MMMKYPDGSRRFSPYRSYLQAALEARSRATYDFGGAVKDGALAAGRATASSPVRLFRWLDRTRRLRAARRELEALDDHLLADLGISRQDIDDVVRYGKPAPDLRTESRQPYEIRQAARVVELRREPDLLGAMIVHGPWGRYSGRPRKRSDAA